MLNNAKLIKFMEWAYSRVRAVHSGPQGVRWKTGRV